MVFFQRQREYRIAAYDGNDDLPESLASSVSRASSNSLHLLWVLILQR
jgi:hypothetical protein